MFHIVDAIHDLETLINSKNEDIYTVFDDYDLQNSFQKDLDLIDKKLGKDFLSTKRTFNIEQDTSLFMVCCLVILYI